MCPQASPRGRDASEQLPAFLRAWSVLQSESVMARERESSVEREVEGWAAEDGYRCRPGTHISACSSNSSIGSLLIPGDCVPLTFHSRLAWLCRTATCNKDIHLITTCYNKPSPKRRKNTLRIIMQSHFNCSPVAVYTSVSSLMCVLCETWTHVRNAVSDHLRHGYLNKKKRGNMSLRNVGAHLPDYAVS